MSGPKNQTNTQWGRVNQDGETGVLPSAEDYGREPLVNHLGHVFVAQSLNAIWNVSLVPSPSPNTYNYTKTASPTGESYHSVKTSPGTFFGAWGSYVSDSDEPAWLQLHDIIGVIPAGSIPIAHVFCGPPNVGMFGNANIQSCYLEVPVYGIYCSTGISIGFSSTSGVYNPILNNYYSALFL
jgi:hypothetical protein